MPEDRIRNIPSQTERWEYTSLVNSAARTLDLHGGLTEAIAVAHYTAMSGSISNLLDLERGLQAALATMNTRAELDLLVLKDATLGDVPSSINRLTSSASTACPAPGHAADRVTSSYTSVRDEATRLQAAELVQRAAQSDPAAWQEIVRRYSGLVAAKVRTFRLQDADAFDAMQTTWLRLMENVHRIQHPERLGGWLSTTAARECLNILRRAQRTTTLTDAMINALDEPPARYLPRRSRPAQSSEERIIDAHTAQKLRKLIDELTPQRRRLLRALFTNHPTPIAEPSCTTGTPSSIGTTRRRALRQLGQELLDQERQQKLLG